MRKRHHDKILGRSQGARVALFRSLTLELIKHGSIETSEARGKAIRGFVQRVVATGIKQNLQSERRLRKLLAIDSIKVQEVSNKLGKISLGVGESATRLIKLDARVSDSSSRIKIILKKINV